MIETVPETGSTNADLATRLRAGAFVPEGDWLVADRQTAGRGRQGREWFDGMGNFMGSTVVHRRFGEPDPPTLALAAGLALHSTIAALVLAKVGSGSRIDASSRPQASDRGPIMLKWPNDVTIGTAKLAGILLEREGDAVVVGIGANLVSAPKLVDRETAALSDIAEPPRRDVFAATLARQFDLEIERWRNFGVAPIVQRWQDAAHPPGTPLCVGEPGETPLEGTFAGLTDDGALLLRLADGGTRAIHAGEVRFARSDG